MCKKICRNLSHKIDQPELNEKKSYYMNFKHKNKKYIYMPLQFM